MTPADIDALLADTRYALRQCKDFRDPARAADALERIEERLERLAEEGTDPYAPTDAEIEELRRECDAAGPVPDDVPY